MQQGIKRETTFLEKVSVSASWYLWSRWKGTITRGIRGEKEQNYEIITLGKSSARGGLKSRWPSLQGPIGQKGTLEVYNTFTLSCFLS